MFESMSSRELYKLKQKILQIIRKRYGLNFEEYLPMWSKYIVLIHIFGITDFL